MGHNRHVVYPLQTGFSHGNGDYPLTFAKPIAYLYHLLCLTASEVVHCMSSKEIGHERDIIKRHFAQVLQADILLNGTLKWAIIRGILAYPPKRL